MVEEKVKGAKLVSKLIESPSKLLGAILVGNNIVNIAASAIATSLAIKFFGNTGVGVATGIMTLLVLIFGEITPKTLAATYSEKFATRVARPVWFLVKVLNPIIVALTAITNLIIRAFGGKADSRQPFITEEEMKTMVDVGHEEGIIQIEERDMLHSVFRFGDSLAKEVMVPRTEIAAIDVRSTYDDIFEVFKKEQYSRMPVYNNSLDNIVGILHVKDIFFFDNRKEQFVVEKNVRKTYFTFENKRIAELIEEMRKKRVQMAVVTDEYGGTAGIITMQDLVEEIFGDIEDEYDDTFDEIQSIGVNEYIVDGRIRLDSINQLLGTECESDNYETFSGYLIGFIGRFPKKGDIFTVHGLECTIMDVYRSSIRRLKIRVSE